jgi:hypothetical protein
VPGRHVCQQLVEVEPVIVAAVHGFVEAQREGIRTLETATASHGSDFISRSFF